MRSLRTIIVLILAVALWGCAGTGGVRLNPGTQNREGPRGSLSGCGVAEGGLGNHVSVCRLRREPELDEVAR